MSHSYSLCLQIIAAARDVQEKTEIYTPYNILPLDSAGVSLPIMQFEEVLLLYVDVDVVCLVESLCLIWHGTEFFGFLLLLD